MPLYENSVIYKLVHKNDQDNENIYIGSTTNFRGRKVKHREKYYDKNAKEYNYKVYQFIRENGGWDEWEMVAIETYPCESKRELEIRERFHIETLKSKLNQIIPTRTKKEYREENKELIKENKKQEYENNKEHIKARSLKNYYAKHEENKEKRKQYREDNREKILEQNKQYREDNREKILEQKKQHYQDNREKILEKQKQHYQDNRDKRLEKNKQYHQDNREKILEQNKEKVLCECGCISSRGNLNRHRNTDKHKKKMEELNK